MAFRNARARRPRGTKEKILTEAAVMFTRSGYAAVSIRDIAKRVNIKSASIYAHFSSKEEILDVILDNMKAVYLEHYVKLDEEIARAKSFPDVLDCLFGQLKKIYNIYIYYGVSLVVTEQFSNEKAREIFSDVLLKVGVDYIRAKFAMCIRKKWVKKFDTAAAATMIMNTLVMATILLTREEMKQQPACDAGKMVASMRKFILNSVEIVK